MTDAGTVLRVDGAGRWFGDGTVALQEVSMRLRAGEFVSVVGPSGCGKSTLLRIASGLDRPDAGTLHRATDNIGYVFQDPTLLPWRSVQRNVELLAELRKVPRERRRRAATEAIERVGLAEFARHRPAALSGGMRMRVSLARALTLRPELFLFDEPFGALDELTRDRLSDELQALFAADRFAALFVTHSVSEAVYLSDRVLVMSARPGRILADVAVGFEHPRPSRIRFDAAFTELTARISDLLRGDRDDGDRDDPAPVGRAERGRR